MSPKVLAMVSAMVFAAVSQATTWNYTKTGGTAADLADPACWTDKDGNHGVPVTGDTAQIRAGADLTLENAGIVGPRITFAVLANSTGYGTLVVGDGTTISNCAITVGEKDKTLYGENRALFVLKGTGVIYSGTKNDGTERQYLTVYENGKVEQIGGDNEMYAASIFGWYQHDSGLCHIVGSSLYLSTDYGEKRGYHLTDTSSFTGWFAVNNSYTLENITKNIFGTTVSDNGMRFEVPNADKGTGHLTITNCQTFVPEIMLAKKRNDAANVQTGYLDIIDSTLGLGKLDLSTKNVDSYARVTVDNSFVYRNGMTISGTTADALRHRVDFLIGNGSAWSCNQHNPLTDYADFLTTKSYDLTLGAGAHVTVDGASALYNDGVYLGSGSELVVDGSRLGMAWISGNGSTRTGAPIVFRACNGALVETYSMTQRETQLNQRFYLGCKQTGQSSMAPIGDDFYFYLDNATLTNRNNNYCLLNFGAPTSANIIHFEVSGKSNMRMTGYDWYASVQPTDGRVELVFRGGQHTAAFKEINAGSKHFLFEFVADATPGHIAPVTLARSADTSDCVGDLRVRLDGGVQILNGATEFTVLKHEAKDFKKEFLSTPETVGSTLWTTTYGKRAVKVSLADPIATLAPGAATLTLDAAKPMGLIEIPVGATDGLEELQVRMNLENATPAQVEALIAEMRRAGFSTSAADKTGTGFDLTVGIPPAMLAPNASNRFAWDFTRTYSDDYENAVTLAKVTSLKVVEKHPVVRSYIHFR